MTKSTRDYIKRKLEQSRTHTEAIFQHLSFIENKYSDGDYESHLRGIYTMMETVKDLDVMLKEFRKIA